MSQKKYSAVGKTAAMVLHELFPSLKENCAYETLELHGKSPRFRCSFIIDEKAYSAEGSSKKIAKQLACKAVLKELRPDIIIEESSFEKAEEENGICSRPGPPTQVLLPALSFEDRTIPMDTEAVDQKPVLVDGKVVKMNTGKPGGLPAKASASLKRPAAVVSSCCALHTLMVKQYGHFPPDIVYSEGIDISEVPNKSPLFKCFLTLNKKDVFEGIGKSVKAAKNVAAEKALQEHFKFDRLSEGAVETLVSKRKRLDKLGQMCNDISSLVRNVYQSICQLQGCPFTTYISAFVIISPKGEKTLVALGTGRDAVIDERSLKASRGSLLIHMQSTVLARRAFLLYLHRQLEKAESPDSMFVKAESGKYCLKPGYKVVLYTSFPPNAAHNLPERPPLTSTYGSENEFGVTPNSVQKSDEPVGGSLVNVMSIEDKMLKWNYLGLQGALLSYIVEPIFISYYFIAAPSNDRAVAHAVLLRFGDFRKDEFVVRSGHTTVCPQGNLYHNWVSEIGTLECLDPSTGRTASGTLSRLSKSELFGSWKRLLTAVRGTEERFLGTCAEAKKAEPIYTSAVANFHEEFKKLGFGIWQKKDSFVDSFTVE